jgi:hypothetical protein
MKKKYIASCIAALTVLSAALTTVSAQVNTLYHMETVSTRHELNPSFQPVPNGYYSTLPVFSGFYFNAGNNSLVFEDLLYLQKNGGNNKTTWFFNNENSIGNFYNNLKKTTNIYSEADLRLFAFGFRIFDNAYITAGLDTKVSVSSTVPKDLLKLLVYGTNDTVGINSFNFNKFGVKASAYTELALGYSQKIFPKLTLGGKLKFLVGHANVNTKIDNFKLNASRDKWDLEINGTANMSLPGAEYELDKQGKIGSVNMEDFAASDLWGGFGLAIDLGANYKLLDDRLTVSASLLDLGFIAWKAKNVSNMLVDGRFEFEGIDFEFENGVAKWDEGYFDNLIEENIDYTTTFESYTSSLAAKVLLGVEYGILDNKLTFGGLSKSTIINKTVFQEITASVNYLQFKYFNASLSYSLLNGHFGTVGIGLGGRLGPVNLYLAGDYFPAKYTNRFIPYRNEAFNFQMGILFNFGYKAKKIEKSKTEEYDDTTILN